MAAKQYILKALPAVTMVLLGLVIYWPGLNGPFVFDDLSNIIVIDSLKITSLDFSSLYHAAFSREAASHARPISMLSFALNYYFSGLDVFAYKLANLLIHVLNGIGIYYLSLILLRQAANQFPNIKILDGNKLVLTSFFTALIFLAHPLNLTSVLYVVQRMASLSTLFVIYGLIVYCLGRLRVIKGEKWGVLISLLSVPLFTVLSVSCKENGALFPAYVVLIELVFFRLSSHNSISTVFRRLWFLFVLVPVLAGVVVAVFNVNDVLSMRSYKFRDFTMWERLMTESRVLLFYLRLILVPNIKEMGLYHDDFALSEGLLSPVTTLGSISVILILLAGSIRLHRKYPIPCFAVLWFLLAHSIESTIIPLELVHEHRNYIAMYGIVLALVYFLVNTTVTIGNRKDIGIIVIALYASLISTLTYARSSYWSNEWALYATTVVGHPDSARAHTQLAILYHDNKTYDDAEYHFRKASDLAPRDAAPVGRLAQHLLIATGSIPNPVFKELKTRLENYPISYVTLWTIQPILMTSAKKKKLHAKLLSLYENAVIRYVNRDFLANSNTELKRRSALYRTLARSFREQNNLPKSIGYYEKAIKNHPVPMDYIAAANGYLKSGDHKNAKRVYAIVKSKDAELKSEDAEHLEKLGKRLKR